MKDGTDYMMENNGDMEIAIGTVLVLVNLLS